MKVDILSQHFVLINEAKEEISHSFEEFNNSSWNINNVLVELCKLGVEYKVDINVCGKKSISSASIADNLYDAYYKAYDNLALWEGAI